MGMRLGELGIEPDLIRWTDSFMSDRRVKLMLEGRGGEDHEVETGVPQGSPVAPILFARHTCLGSLTMWKRHALASKACRLWTMWHGGEGKPEKEVAEALSRAVGAALDRARINGVTFNHAKTEAMFLSSVQAMEEIHGVGTDWGA